MKKKIGLAVLVLLIIGVSVYFYAYKDHRDIATESSDFTITVANLRAEFSANVDKSNAKFQDKTIQVSGKITDIDLDSKGIVVDNNLFGTFKDSIPAGITQGNQITIKGRFIGYDDLLEEFKIDQITVVK